MFFSWLTTIRLSLSMYMYVFHMYTHICMYVYMYISMFMHVYIERDRCLLCRERYFFIIYVNVLLTLLSPDKLLFSYKHFTAQISPPLWNLPRLIQEVSTRLFFMILQPSVQTYVRELLMLPVVYPFTGQWYQLDCKPLMLKDALYSFGSLS